MTSPQVQPQPLSAATPAGPAGSRGRRALFLLHMMRDPLATVGERFARYGDLYYVSNPGAPLYVTRDSDVIRQLLVTRATAFSKGHPSLRRLTQIIGDSLVTSDGEAWLRQRRLVQPAFTRPRLAEYAEVMAEEAECQAEELATSTPRSVDMGAIMTGLTLRIVARTLFSQRVDDGPRIGRAMRFLNASFTTPDLWPKGLPTPGRYRVQRATQDLDAAVFDIIQHRRRLLEHGQTPPSDLLQRLLMARDEEGNGGGLSDQEIRDQLLTLYVAGHDTTSHAVTWTLYLLSQHAAVLARLRDELDGCLGVRRPTFEDLAQLTYTSWVFKEAMRLYPPVVAIPRRAEQDTELGGYTVPRGAEAIAWVYHTQRNPRYFPEPARFHPDRFSPDQETQRTRHAYLPFGAGPRACIGQLFATHEAQLILACLVRRLDFAYVGRVPPRLRVGVTLAPKDGMPMRIGLRA